VETLIVYKSRYRGNTEKIAKVIAEVMSAKLLKVEGVQPQELPAYDLIGFGSGIYGGRHDRGLIKLIENMPPMDKNVFIFSTYASFRERYHALIKEKLAEKGCKVVGEFSCLGVYGGMLGLNRDLKGALGWIAGRSKGHPDERDLENARAFAKGLLNA